MDDKAFENKVNRDIDKTKADVATLGEDVTTLGEDGVTGLSRKFDQLTNDTKQMVAARVKTINQEVGQGLSHTMQKSGICRQSPRRLRQEGCQIPLGDDHDVHGFWPDAGVVTQTWPAAHRVVLDWYHSQEGLTLLVETSCECRPFA